MGGNPSRETEPQVVREYRHLLRTGSTDWQETAHRHALTSLGARDRAAVLAEVQRLLLAGTRLGGDDVHAIARLVVLGERRRPRVLLDGMQPELLQRLAAATVASPIGRMLRAGYDIWDGEEPPEPHEVVDERSHTAWSGQWGTEAGVGELGAAWIAAPPPRRQR